MEISIFLGKFWGTFLLSFSTIFLLRKKILEEFIGLFLKDRKIIFVFGYFSLIFGLATILLHNIWVLSWKILITLFGWALFIKGIFLIVLPEFFQKIEKFFEKRILLIQLILLISWILGIWLIFRSSF